MFLSPQPVYRILDKQRNQRLLLAHNVYKILFPDYKINRRDQENTGLEADPFRSQCQDS